MENCGVSCNVKECLFHSGENKCSLERIEVSHERTSSDSMSIPHFCKSYEKK